MGGDYQMWIDEPSGQPPGDQGPPPPRSRRWIVVVVGFVVLAGALVVQRSLSGGGADADSVIGVTAPTTSSPSPSPTGMTSSPPSPRPTSEGTSDPSPVSQTRGGSASPDRSTTRTADPGQSGGVSVTTSTPPFPPPTITTAPLFHLSGAPFELAGVAWNASISSTAVVYRFHSDTGRIERTETPAMMSNGPVSFAAAADAVIVRPWDNVPGYVVPDGQPAEFAGGYLATGSAVLPAAQPDRLWVATPDAAGGGNTVLTQVDSTGEATGPVITPPTSLGMNVQGAWGFTRDGAGGVLARGVGGVYELAPGAARLVTHGAVLAAGPTGYLVYECDDEATCAASVMDRATRQRRKLADYVPPAAAMAGQAQGVMSPDGRYAAVLDFGATGPPMSVVDLHSGTAHPIPAPISGTFTVDAASLFAFTSDSAHLLAAAAGGVIVVDPSTGATIQQLPIPPVAAIALQSSR